MIIMTASLTPSTGKQNAIVFSLWARFATRNFPFALFLAPFSLLIDCPPPIPESNTCLFTNHVASKLSHAFSDAFTTTRHQVARYGDPGQTRLPRDASFTLGFKGIARQRRTKGWLKTTPAS